MFKKWAYILNLIVVLNAFDQVNAIESAGEHEAIQAELEVTDLERKMEEDATEDTQASDNEADDIQNAYRFMMNDSNAVMEVNSANVNELIGELKNYYSSSSASEEEKLKINKWLFSLESIVSKLQSKAKKTTKNETRADISAIIALINSPIVKGDINTRNANLEKLLNIDIKQLDYDTLAKLKIRLHKELGYVSKTNPLRQEISDKIRTVTTEMVRAGELKRNKAQTIKTSKVTKVEENGVDNVSDQEKPNSESFSDSKSNTSPLGTNGSSAKKEIYIPIPSDPYFKHSDLEKLFAIDVTKLDVTQLNNLNNRLNQEVRLHKTSEEVKKEIRIKIQDIGVVLNIRANQLTNKSDGQLSDSEIKAKLKSKSELPKGTQVFVNTNGLNNLLNADLQSLSVEQLNKLRILLVSELSPKKSISETTRKEVVEKVVQLDLIAPVRAKFEYEERQRKEKEEKAKFEYEERQRKEKEEKAKSEYEEKQRKEKEEKTKSEYEKKQRKEKEEKARKHDDLLGNNNQMKKNVTTSFPKTNSSKAANTAIYSIQNTVNRMKIIDMSRSSMALEE